MKNMLLNEKGSLVIAVIVAVFAALSGLSISFLAYRDTFALVLQMESTQQTHFLRSEADRASRYSQYLEDDQGKNISREVWVPALNQSGSRHKTLYSLETKIEEGDIVAPDGFTRIASKRIITNSKSSRRSIYLTNSRASIVRKRAIKQIKKELAASFFYFTDTDESPNADGGVDASHVYFYPPDVLEGRVHSNSAIRIKANGGSYPIFLGMVTTGEEFEWFNPSSPNYDIFEGGYAEHFGKYDFSATADEVRAFGIRPFGDENSSQFDLIYTKIDGSTITSKQAQIISWRDTLEVFGPQYPYVQNTVIGHNIITMKDTVWFEGPTLTLSGAQSIFVPKKLWIQGTVSGNQTWGCADTIFITGDLLLSNTPMGESPFNPETGEIANTSDLLGIVSEQQVIIKYKHRDPFEGDVVKSPNCNDIFIYAAICALGNGDGDPHKDGIFTFEYQHPHSSTEHIYYQDSLYTWIDLHRYKLPLSPFDDPLSWPGDVDWPWYNPVYPEANINPVFRGNINLWGSIMQIRRGFVARSGNDPYNHTNGLWDLQNHKYGDGGHGRTGYDKNYHFDIRFEYMQPINYPELKRDGGHPYVGVSWQLVTAPEP
ncbi:MAG: hypothetical protein PHR06_12170 [Candidatus Cloacimonetes bacterium]|nr:hypothetical protein [Candidatus Cloacimonadota bacterium]